jgi:regulator of protease activity HflC (stomatin/prohibitin superfamily)
MSDGAGAGFGFGAAVSLFVVIVGCGMLYGCPQYSVYSSRMAGEAELAQAEYSRQVQVREAQGKLDASKLLAQVEINRADGVAKANTIIGDSLRNNEAYLKYLWITDVAGTTKPSVIYVPTEANIPILEAGRFPALPAK